MRELAEVLGVGVVIEGEVGPQHAQLVLLERRPQALRTTRRRRRRTVDHAVTAVHFTHW